MARAVEMTELRALKAVLFLREAVAAYDRDELSIGALEIVLRNEIWPVEPDEDDLAWARDEVARLAPLILARQKRKTPEG
jgi:hypothetical protein